MILEWGRGSKGVIVHPYYSKFLQGFYIHGYTHERGQHSTLSGHDANANTLSSKPPGPLHQSQSGSQRPPDSGLAFSLITQTSRGGTMGRFDLLLRCIL